MMTMLHSVWSGGGSAAGRRRSALALGALLALVASVLIWAAPTQAQNQAPPIAIASVNDPTGEPGEGGATTAELDGSNSFDPDGGELTYEWAVVTESYSWLRLTSGDGEGGGSASTATFVVPTADLAARYGQSIEFRLTVTDDDTPSLSASDTVTFTLNQKPTVDIAVVATMLEEDGDADDADDYTVDAVIDGPGENGNAENEWDIMEGALLTLDGSGSSDANGEIDGYSWERIHPSGEDAAGLPPSGIEAKLSTYDPTDDDTDDAGELVETIANITAGQSPHYAYYTLTVTDDDGVMSTGPVVKLVIHDQPATPEVELTVKAADDDSSVQESKFPSDNPKYIVSPGSTVNITSMATDADDDIASYAWTGGEAADDDSTTDVDESDTNRVLEVDEDAEDGATISVSLAVTDRSGLTGMASVDFQVVTGNTAPEASILNAEIVDVPAQDQIPASRVYTTDDGSAGGDPDANGNPTGRITLRGIGFDPDQPAGSLIYNWSEIDPAAEAPVDPDDAVLDLEPSGDSVSFDVPELGDGSDPDPDDGSDPTIPTTVVLTLSVLDQHGAIGNSTVIIIITPVNSAPSADAGDDQIVEPESFVRLNGAGSSDPDKDEGDLTHAWALTNIATSPVLGPAVTKAVSDQVHKDLAAYLPIEDPSDSSQTIYPDPLTGSGTKYPYFDAPKVADGISSIRLTFTLTVTDDDEEADSDSVTITIANQFFSGNIAGPNFCRNHSLGGPETFAFDSDGDGVADICSLDTTRRAAVARQNALETLVAIGSTIDVVGTTNNVETPDETATTKATFATLVAGQTGKPAPNEAPDAEMGIEAIPAVGEVIGTCASASDMLGDDSEADLAADVCATGRVSGPPAPHDPATADMFFSGVVTGPNFCTNDSLGGARTYAYDSDGDDVADMCVLPYTRREAVARQAALELFEGHGQYPDALKAACVALGTTDFGDDPADLARDECVVDAPDAQRGEALPTPQAASDG